MYGTYVCMCVCILYIDISIKRKERKETHSFLYYFYMNELIENYMCKLKRVFCPTNKSL